MLKPLHWPTGVFQEMLSSSTARRRARPRRRSYGTKMRTPWSRRAPWASSMTAPSCASATSATRTSATTRASRATARGRCRTPRASSSPGARSSLWVLCECWETRWYRWHFSYYDIHKVGTPIAPTSDHAMSSIRFSSQSLKSRSLSSYGQYEPSVILNSICRCHQRTKRS